jgi:pimeloyl-ACP methyl ester carboxylesterase
MNRIRRAYAYTSRGHIHYRSSDGNGIPLVLLHQTPSSSVMYERLMEQLAGEFYTLAPDTPGFGGSDKCAPVSIAAYAEALHEALTIIGVSECYLFGHHTGASIAVQIAHDHPDFVHKLALCGAPYLTREQKAALKASAPPFTLQEDGAHLLGMWQRIRGKSASASLALSQREMLLALQAEEQYAAAYGAVAEHDFEGQLVALQCPVLVMAGEHDSLRASLESAYAALQQGTMREIQRADTYVCDTHPQVIANILKDFFSTQ